MAPLVTALTSVTVGAAMEVTAKARAAMTEVVNETMLTNLGGMIGRMAV